MRLYYLNSNSKIVEAQGTCSGFVCNWVNNVVSNVTALSTSDLAAAWLGSSGIRVYYLSSTSYVSELAEANGWNSGVTVGPQAYSSSSLAVSVPDGTTDLQVYYLSPDMALSQIGYGNGWSQGSFISSPMRRSSLTLNHLKALLFRRASALNLTSPSPQSPKLILQPEPSITSTRLKSLTSYSTRKTPG